MVRFDDVVREVKVNVDPEQSGLKRYVAGEHMNTDDLHIRHWGSIGEGYLGPAFHRKFVKGQILYGSRRTYLRKVAVADFDGICANTTFVLEPKDDELIPELLPFIMQTESFSTHAVKQSRGSVNPYVNWKDIAWYEFAIPPKDEQRRIADILCCLDQVYENWLNSNMISQTLLNKITESIFSRSNFPRERLGEHVVESAYGPRFSNALYSESGSLGCIRTTDLLEDGTIIYSTIPRASLSPEEYKSHILRTGDFLISRSGTCGIGSVFEQQNDLMIPGAFLIRLRLKESLNPNFLKEYVNSSVGQSQLASLAQGGVQKNIRGSSLLNEKVPVPPRTRQNQVVGIISHLRQAKNQIIKHMEIINSLKRNLLNDILR